MSDDTKGLEWQNQDPENKSLQDLEIKYAQAIEVIKSLQSRIELLEGE